MLTELQAARRASAAFAGKAGFITLRDLFRWGERYRQAEVAGLHDWDLQLAEEGYLVLAARVRRAEEEQQVRTFRLEGLAAQVQARELSSSHRFE